MKENQRKCFVLGNLPKLRAKWSLMSYWMLTTTNFFNRATACCIVLADVYQKGYFNTYYVHTYTRKCHKPYLKLVWRDYELVTLRCMSHLMQQANTLVNNMPGRLICIQIWWDINFGYGVWTVNWTSFQQKYWTLVKTKLRRVRHRFCICDSLLTCLKMNENAPVGAQHQWASLNADVL